MAWFEKRRATRFTVNWSATLVDEVSQRKQSIRICNISREGCSVIGNDMIDARRVYKLHFSLPPGNGDVLGLPIVTTCQVARVTLSADQNYYCAGLQFVNYSGSAQSAMEKFLTRLASLPETERA